MKYQKTNPTSTLNLREEDVVGMVVGFGVLAMLVAAVKAGDSYTRGYDDGRRDMIDRTVYVRST